MDAHTTPPYGLSVTLAASFDEVIDRVKTAFKEEGFGVLTEMNVQHTLQEKIGFQMDPYLILGMCNPTLASRTITAEPNIGLFLPCNVEVSAQNPLFMVPMTGNEALQSIAQET